MTGLDELTAILRKHAEINAYRGYIIRVHPAALDAIRAAAAPAPERPAWQPAPFAALFGLDLVRDGDQPAGGWALVKVEYVREPAPVWCRRVETVVKVGTVDLVRGTP